MILLLVAVAAVAVVVAVARNERRRRRLDTTTVELRADEVGVARTLGNGHTERVRWASLEEVEVLTVTPGRTLLVLRGSAEEGCLVPLTLAVEHGIVDRLHRLPRFDARALVQALEAEPPARTVCWRRPG